MFDERVKHLFGANLLKIRDEITVEEKNGLLVIKVPIDRTKFKNKLSSYSEVLKKYFTGYHLYVLSRTKKRRGLGRLFSILFQNSRKSVMAEMKGFMPNYLATKGDINLLVTQNDEGMVACELPSIEDEFFSFRGYRYKKANEIFIK